MSKRCCENKNPDRLNKVGGQAVIEGVMMKAGTRTVTTCRKDDGTLVVTDGNFVSVRKKLKFLNIPILRGVVNFVEMMCLSVKTLSASADALGIEEEDDGKASEWTKKHLGIRLTDLIMIVSVILGLALSVGLFILLPTWVSFGVDWLLNRFAGVSLGIYTAAVEGFVKIVIFLVYLELTSLYPDIRRTFMYHGAEHKSIACFESGDELTPENAMKHTRFHPRCGTSFMFIMILLGVFAGFCIKIVDPEIGRWQYTGLRLLILPIVMGLGYEFIMLAGKHDNALTRALSAPGLWVQRITTKEPTIDMLEVAIVSIKCALRDDFPEFGEFYAARGWERKSNAETDEVTEGESARESDSVSDPEAHEPNGDASEEVSNGQEAPAEAIAERVKEENEA